MDRTIAPARAVSARARVAAHSHDAPAPQFGIISPANGSTYLIDPTLRLDFQRLPLRAAAARGSVEWRIDGRAVSTSDWPLARGPHRVTARDASGRIVESTITVR
jgi:hypothetical protein